MERTSHGAQDGFVTLQALDPKRNVARRYYIEVSTDLFGATIVDHAWGRIGSAGRGRRVSFHERPEALRFVLGLLLRRASARRRIGVSYRFTDGSGLFNTVSSADEVTITALAFSSNHDGGG